MDPFKNEIVRLLEKHPYSVEQIFQRVVQDGFDGGYGIVKRYVRRVRPPKSKAYLKLCFAPGECAQVDWGSFGFVNVGSAIRKLSFFLMVLCYSRMLYLEFTLLQTMEHFLDCHQKPLPFFGGVPLKIMVEDINLEAGYIHISHPKEKIKLGKYAYLREENIALIRSLPRGLPEMFFFRHPKSCQGVIPGGQFGPKYFKVWWDRACKNLGIEGVDIYGGTKHSTATALGKHLSPEQIKICAGHMTNKAFDRYFQPDREKALKVYRTSRDIQKGAGKVIDIKDKFKQP